MRIDARPRVRRRLAAIIKTRPHEAAAQPRAIREIAPPTFGRGGPAHREIVVGFNVAAHFVARINAARADGAGLFRADVRLIGMLGVIIIHALTDVIIPTAHFETAHQAVEIIAHVFRRSDGARGIKLFDQALHRGADASTIG